MADQTVSIMKSGADGTLSLVHWRVQGKLDARVVLRALSQLSAEPVPAPPLIELLGMVASASSPEVESLTDHLRSVCHREALAARTQLVAGLGVPPEAAVTLAGLPFEAPLRWRDVAATRRALSSALVAGRDGLLLDGHAEAAPVTARAVHDHFEHAVNHALPQLLAQGGMFEPGLLAAAQAAAPSPWPAQVTRVLTLALEQFQAEVQRRAAQALDEATAPLADTIDEAQALACWTQRWQQATHPAEQQRLLDLLCAWPSPRAAAPLRNSVQPGWSQERAQITLTLRFGLDWVNSWPQWSR